MRYNRGFIWTFVMGVLISIFTSIVSAYGWMDYYFQPQQLFQSEWFSFAVTFVFFYAVVFFASLKAFRNERPVAAVLAFALAMLISYGLMSRGYLNFYTSDAFFDWIIVIAVVILIGLFFRFLHGHANEGWLIFGLVIVWIVFSFMYHTDGLPFYSLPWQLEVFFGIMAGWIGFIVLVIVSMAIWFNKPDVKIETRSR